MKYIALLRGINVGGKNRVSMADLKKHLLDADFENVSTYINSGNVLLSTSQPASYVEKEIQKILSNNFDLDVPQLKVLVLNAAQLKEVIDTKPEGFGDSPDKFHSDVIFLMNLKPAEAMTSFRPREGVDTIWQGHEVIYSQRLSALRTKSRLNQVMSSPLYKSMTIRNWNTTTKLLELIETV